MGELCSWEYFVLVGLGHGWGWNCWGLKVGVGWGDGFRGVEKWFMYCVGG